MMNRLPVQIVRSGRLCPPRIRMSMALGALSWLVAVGVLAPATPPLHAAQLQTQSAIDMSWEMRFGCCGVPLVQGDRVSKIGPAPIGGFTQPFGFHDPVWGSWTGANSGVARGVSAGPGGIGPSTFSAEAASSGVASGNFS